MYRAWTRFRRLSATRKRLLFEATLLVSVVRSALGVLPFRWVMRTVEEKAEMRVGDREADEGEMQRILWAIGRAARLLVPNRPCLTQALAARFMLARRGCDARLIIGVAKGDDESLKAHAWLERQGVVILGGADSPSQYRSFPSIPLSSR